MIPVPLDGTVRPFERLKTVPPSIVQTALPRRLQAKQISVQSRDLLGLGIAQSSAATLTRWSRAAHTRRNAHRISCTASPVQMPRHGLESQPHVRHRTTSLRGLRLLVKTLAPLLGSSAASAG
jgi:hypothetical protein